MTIEEAIKTIDTYAAAALGNESMKETAKAFIMAGNVLRTQRDLEKNEPLTIKELRNMAGQPVYCADYDRWGIVDVELGGKWKNIPFLTYSENGINFGYNIKKRRLNCYRRPPVKEERDGN